MLLLPQGGTLLRVVLPLLCAVRAYASARRLPTTVIAAVDAVGAAAEAAVESIFELTSNEGLPLSELPHLNVLGQRCQQSVRRALAEAEADPPTRLQLYPDPMHGVSVAARTDPEDVRLVFFILASRHGAPATVSRLVRALYHPSHLFLIHVDLKANASTHETLASFASRRLNVHVLKTRRLVQWGGFSMVSALMDSISSFIKRVDFDFFMNLSDADLALRTSVELMAFLRQFKGRAFLRVEPQASAKATADQAGHGSSFDAEDGADDDGADGAAVERRQPSSAQRHAFGDALWRQPVIECGGFGFVSVNSTANATPPRLAHGPPCCIGQSGPLLHATLPFEPPQPPPSTYGIWRGSQVSFVSPPVLPSAPIALTHLACPCSCHVLYSSTTVIRHHIPAPICSCPHDPMCIDRRSAHTFPPHSGPSSQRVCASIWLLTRRLCVGRVSLSGGCFLTSTSCPQVLLRRRTRTRRHDSLVTLCDPAGSFPSPCPSLSGSPLLACYHLTSLSLTSHLIHRALPRRWRGPRAFACLCSPVLMNSPAHRAVLINHNLRYELWPESRDAQRSYWAELPESEWGGAMFLDGSSLRTAMRSPMVFAKKVLPSINPTLLPR